MANHTLYYGAHDKELNNSGSSCSVNDSCMDRGNYTEDDLYYVPPGLVVLLSFLYGSISLLAVVGNTLVITVIAKNKSMQTVTNFYIANLAIADVLIGIFSIPFQFQAALLQRWDLPEFLCPVAPFFKEMTVNVSIITLTVISIDRYMAIVHPLKPRCSRRVAKAVMAVVWTFSLCSGIPMAIIFSVEKEELYPGRYVYKCHPHFPKNDLVVDLGKLYRLYLIIVQYFFPLIIICVAYFRVMYTIWGNQAPGSAVDARDQKLNKNKRKVIKMLVIVVAMFAFCWLPLQTYNLLSEIFQEINLYRYINIIWFCSHWLAMSNSCCNPFIYGLLNERYKNAFRQLFRTCPCRCCRCDVKENTVFFEHSECSVRRNSNTNTHTTNVQLNGRFKRYLRVNANDAEQSYV
uniref:Orphan G-protein coupled receptor 24 n=1 Tax=Platynereis dumerilii TaxID=6359 RepID=A0A0K0PUH1_PLADU|nr:orphan G-protein coupled receptor 24 [Platynereis dumerilii]